MADQLCCICGVVGYSELIATCSKCQIVREHLYCMPVVIHEIPEIWLCHNCTLDEAKSPDDSGLQAQPKMPRHGKTSKVKFLPAEEVVKLSSGGMKGPPKFNASIIPQRTSKSRKVFDIYNSVPRPLFKAPKESQERSSAKMPPKVCGVNKQALATGLSPSVQPSKKVKVADRYACNSSMLRHGLPVTSPGKQVPSTSTKFEDTQKERKDIHENTGKQVPSTSTKFEDTQKERKDDSQKERNNGTQKERNNGTRKERKEALMTHEIYAYRDYLPSLYATWKGGFQFVDTRMAGEFYDGFLAKPPCVVHSRAYALSRKIPHILQVKLLSRSDICDDLFHDEGPDLADIALYFFPSSNERSSKNNSFLFELLERDGLLITSLVDGAELVVFTSRQLGLESQYLVNRLNAECLLFGVFCAIKDNQSPIHNLEERTAAVPMLEYGSAVECAYGVPRLELTPKEHDESVNKEIDITSGNTSGPTASSKDMDATIQRLLLEFGSQNSRESNVCALTSNVQIKDKEQPAPVSAISSHSLSLSKVKSEPVNEVEGSNDKKCVKTEHCSMMAPSFSIDGYMTGLSNEDAPRRVADKYLQIFNAEIKKERH